MDRLKAARKASWQGAVVSFILAVLKVGLGLFTQSSALLADGLHTAGDIGVSYIMFKGFVIANKPADDKYNYGYAKAEAITAKILALILVVMALLAGKEAIDGILNSHGEKSNLLAIGAAAFAILAKEYMYRHGVHLAKELKSNALMAEAWHHRNGAFSSVAALVGLIGAHFGFAILDPIAALIVAALIFWAGIRLYLNSLRDLMDSAPEPELYASVVEATTATLGVHNIHGVKARRTGHAVYVDMNMCVPSSSSVAEGYNTAALAKTNILRQNEDIKDVTIQVKPCFKDIRKDSCRSCPRFLEEQIKGVVCDTEDKLSV